MTPQQFIAKWGPGGPAYDLNERQGAQPHFMDLCQLLGVPTPGSHGDYIFEQDTLLLGEARGYADVFKRNHFAWENKAPGRNLDTALKQLLTYSLALSNPPLLVVCDRLTTRIHTQFNGHPSEVHTVLLHEMAQPEKQALLRRLWTDPESFRPKKTSRDITEAAAKSFSTLADGLRSRGPAKAADPQGWQAHADDVAHFLTQCLFCFFAEDVRLLPGRMFEGLVNNKNLTSDKLTAGLTNLFTVMREGGLYGNDDIPWFNGGLFKKVKVPMLSIMEVTELRNAAALNWSAIDVSIFGTLFERGLDPSKRSQLGAHYTDPATILRIVDPVLTRPLLQKWELVAQQIRGLMAKSTNKRRGAYSAGGRHFKASAGDAAFQKAEDLFHGWLADLNDFRVLDPACGSGNFLFLGLKALKDIEHKSHLDAAAMGLDRQADLVTGPHNVLGIELNEYAAELARVTVWIGELQWRIEHGYDFKTNPVLEPLDHIECRDALLTFRVTASDAGQPLPSVIASEAGRPLPSVIASEAGRPLLSVIASEAGRPLLSVIASEARQSMTEVVGSEPGVRAAQTSGPHTLRFLKSAPTSAPPTPLDGVARSTDVEESMGSDQLPGPAAGSHETRAEMGSDPDFAQQNSGSDPISAGSIKPAVQVTEAAWPKASVVIGNPPFLGDKKMRSELGDEYTTTLRKTYEGRVPGGADLVCYWFEKARTAIETNGLGAAGLVATNSIRGGKNRKVLEAICDTTRIYEAWSDEGWVNEGAAVRVSLIAFGHAAQDAVLDGRAVSAIQAGLSIASSADHSDTTQAAALESNKGISFQGPVLVGDFEISYATAIGWLQLPNPNGRSNAEVIRPLSNGRDITSSSRGLWVVDFDFRNEGDASLFEQPFEHVVRSVKPMRDESRDASRRKNWWLHGRSGADYRRATKGIPRYIATSQVSKHRMFVWLPERVWPHQTVIAIARADDTTFGILHSRFHELWSLRMGTSLEDRPRYTPTTCFETFPFPAGLTPADTAHQRTETLPGGAVIPADISEQNQPPAPVFIAQVAIKNIATTTTPSQALQAGLAQGVGAISKSEAYEPPPPVPARPGEPNAKPGERNARPNQRTTQSSVKENASNIAQAAKRLNDLREAWLNPPEWTDRVPEVIPLGMDKSPYPDRILPKPGHEKDLADRTLTKLYNQRPAWLDAAHKTLDAAVAQAYGWSDYRADMQDEEILKRLLALNLARSASSDKKDTKK